MAKQVRKNRLTLPDGNPFGAVEWVFSRQVEAIEPGASVPGQRLGRESFRRLSASGRWKSANAWIERQPPQVSPERNASASASAGITAQTLVSDPRKKTRA